MDIALDLLKKTKVWMILKKLEEKIKKEQKRNKKGRIKWAIYF